jgi:hypothetical protein
VESSNDAGVPQMFLLFSRGRYRELARIIAGAVFVVVGVIVKGTNPRYILIGLGAVMIVWGAAAWLTKMRNKNSSSAL